MVINDHDTVNASGLTVFRDVGKATGIRLPDLAEFVLFIGLTVPEVRISCRFEIVEPDKTLHGIHVDGCREKGFLHEMLINLRGIHAWMLLLNPVDFRDGLVIEGTGKSFVRSDSRHQGIQSTEFVLGLPFFQCFVAVGDRGTIRKGQRGCGDLFVVSRSRGIRIKPLDDRSYQGEAELSHFSVMFESFSVFAHGKSLLLRFFFIISGEHGAIHPPVVCQKMAMSGANTS